MNNLSESFNATILLQRDKPIITMIERIRTYLMGRFATMGEKVMRYNGHVMPKPMKRLDREVEKSGNWFAIFVGGDSFEIICYLFVDKFIVDLGRHPCSCKFWDLVRIP